MHCTKFADSISKSDCDNVRLCYLVYIEVYILYTAYTTPLSVHTTTIKRREKTESKSVLFSLNNSINFNTAKMEFSLK